MEKEKVYAMSVAKIVPLLVAKAVKKGRTEEEVYPVIQWLTGYDPDGIMECIKSEMSYKLFFEQAPLLNPKRKLITGKVCGICVEEIEDSLMQEIRYLDKLIDELAKGRSMDKTLDLFHRTDFFGHQMLGINFSDMII